MKRTAVSSTSTKPSSQARAPSTIEVWAPDDVRDYKLRREEGESEEGESNERFEERKSFFNELLKRGGR